MYPDRCSIFLRQSARVQGNPRLREPQRQAYQQLLRHFEEGNEPALVQIPVGCGKSGLIAMVPFGISRGRVLIVTPNVTIRDAIYKAVDSADEACFWRRMGVATPAADGPFAAKIDGPDVAWSDCAESHFVVTNVQQIGQPRSRWLRQFPADFFDMILIDEGHHNAAASWQRLMHKFPAAKIISLTATPFRSDGMELTGKMVYRYPFLRAMRQGYIKTLRAVHVAPRKISFTYRDGTKQCTLEEILRLREEQWFSRGVALAPECNGHIVRASIEQCERLRAVRGSGQQIIAAACSVEHARQLAELYRASGYACEEIHSQQSKGQRSSILARLRRSQLDCIVQVQMLGEGFDHPPLSVAAVFRPFRSLAPYVQFVGRIMRVMRQNCSGDQDNLGVVVSHVGMNTQRHWEDFRQLDDSDQALWAGLAGREDSAPRGSEGRDHDAPPAERTFSPDMLVAWEVLGEFQNSHYSPSPPQSQHQPAGIEDCPPPGIAGPQQRRRAARSRLQQEVQQAIRAIHHETGLPPLGMHLSRVFYRFRRQNNWAAVRRWVYQELNQRQARQPGPSSQWSLAEIEQAIDMLPEIKQHIRELISTKTTRRQPWRRYGGSSSM